MQPTFDSPFYRVTAKALVFDHERRLLVIRNHNGNWELPGGGWEHDESFEDCLIREIYEELGVDVSKVGDVAFMYRGLNAKRGFHTLRIAAPVELASHAFVLGEDIQHYEFVDKDTFKGLDMMADEGDIDKYLAKIWPDAVAVEKNRDNR